MQKIVVVIFDIPPACQAVSGGARRCCSPTYFPDSTVAIRSSRSHFLWAQTFFTAQRPVPTPQLKEAGKGRPARPPPNRVSQLIRLRPARGTQPRQVPQVQ